MIVMMMTTMMMMKALQLDQTRVGQQREPPPKDDDQSSKKPRESDASATKQHPALTSTGWQITDTRDAGADSSMHRSDPESEHSEQSSDDITMQDEGNDSDMEDTDNAHIPKVSTTTWFKPIPESERPATPEPEWTIPPNDFPEPENNWANTYATAYKVPEENKLQRKTYDIGSFIKWFCRRTGKKKLCKADLEGPAFNLVKAFHKNSVFLQYQMDECHKLLTNKVDLSNPEGHQILRNIYEPLPLGGPPGQVTIQPQFFFNKDLDYLLTGDKERRIALSISKLKAARYLDFGLEELVPSLWVESEREYDISAVYGITHWWFRRKEFYINKHSESSDREAVRSQMRILSVISVKLEGPAFNLAKAFHKNSVFLQYQMDECHKLLTNKVDLYNPEGHQIQRNVYEPLPLGGPPGQVTIQPQFFFNKDLDYLLTGDKERRIALSISKLKAARYLDFGLEELVPTLWVESEREYDISAVYGITHWWFRRKEFYINKHSESSDREAVRSQMRILSVISVKVFEKYGYNYLREIILRRADYQEYKISEKDFKNLHPNDFEDLFLLNIQEKLNHLPKTDKISLHTAVNMWIRNLVIRNRVGDLQLGIESYQTKINLERPNWDAADYYFKEDYTIVPKPRAVVYRDRNDQRKLISKMSKGLKFLIRGENDTYPILLPFTHCGNKSILRVLRIIPVILPEHPSETIAVHNEDGNPARANFKQALGYLKDGDGNGNSYAQDGDPSQDDVRLCLDDDLKKAQDHSQRQAWQSAPASDSRDQNALMSLRAKRSSINLLGHEPIPVFTTLWKQFYTKKSYALSV
ncbi:hypothetical protein Tco_0905504 [Tanacetum coccineum]